MLPNPSIAPIKIAILAMGGEGGGVLADWIVATAEHAGFYAQNTSVPGVAQRTGATIYYVEVLPQPRQTTTVPVLSLMPVPGDVDIVLASELMESARAVQRGLVTQDKTLLITSNNRVYAMPEKMAMGDGRQNSQDLHDAGKQAAQRYVSRNFAALAEQHGSVISASLFGALAASDALPFSRQDFEATIQRSGVGVTNSLAAFDAGYRAYLSGTDQGTDTESAKLTHISEVARPRQTPSVALDPRLNPLNAHIQQTFPEPAHTVLQAAVTRLADYQDLQYAEAYLALLQPICTLASNQDDTCSLLIRCARHLALWMSYEDTVRVAELKIRATRFQRVKQEQNVQDTQLLHINEYFHPRIEEIADTLPVRLGSWLLRDHWVHRLTRRLTRKGRIIHTSRLGGFLMLYLVASMRSWRRQSLRFQREHADITRWLAQISQYAQNHYALACEIAECQTLVKGYGDTHARGLANYQCLMQAVPVLANQADGALQLAKLRQAALADDHGTALSQQLAQLGLQPA